MVHIGGSHVAETVLTALAVLLTILVLASRKGHRIIVFLSSVISWICYSLVFYVIGVALSADPSRDDRSAFLACYVLLFVGLANSIVSGNSIPADAQQIRTASSQQLFQIVFVLGLIFVRRSWSMKLSHIHALLLVPLCLIWVAKHRSRLLSARARSCIKEDLLISEYMATKHNEDREDFDPEDLKGVNYIVSDVITSTRYRGLLRTFLEPLVNFGMVLRELNGTILSHMFGGVHFDNVQYESNPGAMVNRVIRYDNLVTLEDIWKHISRARSDSRRDICMSFALFKLLRRRFRGCHLHESGLVKTRDFVLSSLLSESDPLRAFHTIETELGFLFDFFYKNHMPDLTYASCICFFLVWTLSLWPTYFIVAKTGRDDLLGMQGLIMHQLALTDILFLVVLFLFPITGLYELYSLAFSNWFRVTLLVNISQGRKRESSGLSLTGTLLRMMLSGTEHSLSRAQEGILLTKKRNPSTGSYWSNRVRMYCLFQGDSPSFRFSTSRVSNEAKKALLNSLRHSKGVLCDGRLSLSMNGEEARALSWACNQEFVAEKILVWHVATTLCHVGHAMKSTKLPTRYNHDVAIMFSGYCAYLVGFAPELIADDIYATRLVFDNGQAAALKRLQGEGSLARMQESSAMMDLQSTDFAATTRHDVVFQGKMLAAQLIELPADTQWKVLSEFWTELMLFISPADNAAAHLEKLKTGGELITHVWALLTHAGILERPTSVRDGYTGNKIIVEARTLREATKTKETEIEEMV